jgi:hypothetical protein
VAVGAVLLFFSSRDKSTFSAGAGPGQAFPDLGRRHLRPGERPGVAYNSSPPTSGPHVAAAVRRDATALSDDQVLQALETGDVVLVYGTPRPPAALRSLVADLAGPFDPALAASGQAAILARRAGTRGVVALAWRHLLRATSPGDPRLRDFVDYWLGHATR